MNGRVREQRQARAHDRHRERDVEPVRDAEGHRAAELADRRHHAVHGRHDVGAAAAKLGVVVPEHGGHGDERHAVEMIEGKELIREVDGEPATADRFAAFSQDGAEAAGRAHERTAGIVELVGEARARRWQRNGGQLTGQGDVDEPELRLERAVEMCRVVGAVELHVVAAEDQAVRAEDVFEESSEAGRPALRTSRRGHQHTEEYNRHDSHYHLYLAVTGASARRAETNLLDHPAAVGANERHRRVPVGALQLPVVGEDLVVPEERNGCRRS